MSVWWDEHAKKQRSTLIYKVFYVWTWPLSRWLMFRMDSERAHTFAIHYALPIIGRIDRAWCFCVSTLALVVLVPFIVVLRLIAFLPGFSWEVPEDATREHVERGHGC